MHLPPENLTHHPFKKTKKKEQKGEDYIAFQPFPKACKVLQNISKVFMEQNACKISANDRISSNIFLSILKIDR